MNLKQALYIRTIAREGGITAAAKKLYVSQPSLSQMVRQVESEYGVTLFDRTVSPLRLTYAGEKYLQAANVMLAANDRLENELREIREENSGLLRLGISVQRAMQILPVAMPWFVMQFPKVSIDLREEGSAKLPLQAQDCYQGSRHRRHQAFPELRPGVHTACQNRHPGRQRLRLFYQIRQEGL